MIINDIKEYWVCLEKSKDIADVLYCPEDNDEYIEHWGKWLVFGNSEAVVALAKELDTYVDRGEIDSAKYNREPSPIGKGDCVLCVYCDDRDRERVWNILSSLGLSKRIWKYDQQTYDDWALGGRLRKLHQPSP